MEEMTMVENNKNSGPVRQEPLLLGNGYTLDTLARDIAFEIQLGGDRFDSKDVGEFLHGISAEDLSKFRSRIFYHASDFAPVFQEEVKENDAFVNRSMDAWLSEVRTAESLGVAPKVRFSTEGLLYDRGEFFVTPAIEPQVLRCRMATRYAAWTGKGREPREIVDLYKHVTARQAVDILLDQLTKRYASADGALDACSLDFPLEGKVRRIVPGAEGYCAVFEDGTSRVIPSPSEDVSALADELIVEMDEQRCALHNRDLEHGGLKQLLRSKADTLLDSFGYRLRSDFLYDEIEIVDRSSRKESLPKVFLRRSVDDVSPEHRQHYILSSRNGSPHMTEFSSLSFEDAKAFLQRLDEELDFRVTSEFLSDGLQLENGPMVCLPFADGGSTTMRVDSVFAYNDNVLMVSGRPGGRDDVHPRVIRLDRLSDNGVHAVRQATDLAIKRLLVENGVEPVRKKRQEQAEALKRSESPKQKAGSPGSGLRRGAAPKIG